MNVVFKPCSLCNKESKHFLHYQNVDADWQGYYCDRHFLEKLKGMRKMWNKILGDKV